MLANANPLLDRPVKVCGQALDIHSKNTVLVLAVNKAFKLIYLFDDNILFDNYDPNRPKDTLPKPISMALHNALFKVTPVNGCLLFGELADDMVKVQRAALFLTFGMYAYLPTLPDPYAANINRLRYQFGRPVTLGDRVLYAPTIWLWLVCQTKWQAASPDSDKVDVSFHFAPLQNQFQVAPEAAAGGGAPPGPAPGPGVQPDLAAHPFVKLFSDEGLTAAAKEAGPAVPLGGAAAGEMKAMMAIVEPPDYQKVWDDRFSYYQNDVFALLDVSSNANQMGVSFAFFGRSADGDRPYPRRSRHGHGRRDGRSVPGPSARARRGGPGPFLCVPLPCRRFPGSQCQDVSNLPARL